jgi:FAD-dependent halogenase
MLDVLIAGAGPAGASTAIALAAAGLRVAIVERERFPRPRIGESLPPKIEPLFAALGVLDHVQRAGFVRMRGTTIAIGDRISRHDFDPAGRRGWQVERARFDAILLERAQRLGAEVHQAAIVLEPLRGAGGVEGARIQFSDGVRELPAKITVDATGSAAAIARGLGLRRRESIRTAALTAWWKDARGADDLPPENTLFELLEDGWIWSVLRADGLRNVTLGVDGHALRDRAGAPLDAFYRDTIARSSLLAPVLEGATVEGELTAHDATWAEVEEPIGLGWIVAGDAASVIDPLTSQGVFKAIQSGLAAAAVIRTILTRPERASLAADYYRSAEREFRSRYAEVALSFYRASPFSERPFWSARLDPLRHPDLDTALPSPELRAARRDAFLSRLRSRGGRGVALAASRELRTEQRPAVENGLVIAREGWIADRFAEIPLPHEAVTIAPRLLLPLLDGRAVEAVFEGYSAASTEPPSSDLARRLTIVLGALAELDLVLATITDP